MLGWLLCLNVCVSVGVSVDMGADVGMYSGVSVTVGDSECEHVCVCR